MISDWLQDQAVLYSLGQASAEEATGFEAALRQDPELRTLLREMREALADLAHIVPTRQPPADLRGRILAEIALEKQAASRERSASPRFSWLPWALAALLLICCGLLAIDRARLQRALAEARTADPFVRTSIITLASPTGDHADAKVTVAWQPERQSGIIILQNLPPPGAGRDYQLWAIDANQKEPISAGLIHVDPKGVTHLRFKPEGNATRIQAFAISLEREGGVRKRKGPIVLLGKA